MKQLYLPFLTLICFLFSFYSYAQKGYDNQKTPSYNACRNCNYMTAGGEFYDDGGKEDAIGNDFLVTTFEARPGYSLVFFFTEIDLPDGAKINVYKGDELSKENLVETFWELKKARNIIAEKITIEYVSAYNDRNAKGWKALIKEELTSNIITKAITTQPESDCPNAINLCANNTIVALGGLYTNTGNVNDDSGSCYGGTGSGGSVWYSFTPQTNGPVDFTILPTGTTDYDFVLWDITAGCNSGQRVEMACNYSVATGNTGMSSINCSENVGNCTNNTCSNQSKGSDCNRFNQRVNVQTNRTYAICINFYSGSNDGFTLTFQNEPTSVAITDIVPPTILNAYSTNCTNATTFHVTFSEWVNCTTIQNSDFTLAGHTVTVNTSACSNNRTNAVDITVSPALTPGTYSINAQNILDLCGNNMNSNYNIVLGAAPTPAISAPATVCKSPGFLGIGFSYNPSSQNLTASGGTFYSWNVGQLGATLSVSPTSTTSYTVTVANGSCAATASTTVNVEQASVALGPDTEYCGTPVVLTATPTGTGNNYQFFTNPTFLGNGTSVQNGSSNTLTVSPAATTTYRVVITTPNGCTATDDIVVSIATGSTATINAPATNYCLTANPITLTASPGGGTFSGPGVTGNVFNPATAGVGTHTVSYTVTNGCGTFNGTRTITVSSGALPTLNLSPTYCVTDPQVNLTTSPTCGTLAGPGVNSGICIAGFYITQPSFNPGTAGIGTHTITYSGSNFCANTFTTTVIGSGFAPTVSGANGPYCSSASPITLTGTPTGGTFSGTGVSGSTFNPATAGAGTHIVTYSVTVCGSALTTSVPIQVVAANGTAAISYPSASYCSSMATPQSVTQTGTGGGTYSATPGGLTIDTNTGAITPSTSTTGNYTVFYNIPGTAGCPAINATATVSIGNLSATATSSGNLGCGVSNSTLTASPAGGTYLWSNAATTSTISVSTAGNYTVTVTLSGCSATASVSVTQTGTPPTASASGVNNTHCTVPNGSVSLTSNATTFLWSNGATTQNITGLSAGTYTVTATSAGSCSATASATVSNNTVNPVATVSGNNTVCSGNAATFTASGGGTYLWSNGLTNAIITANTAGNYLVTVTGNNGCTAMASRVLNVNPSIATTTPIEICNVVNGTYTVTFTISGGNGTYSVNGTPVAGNNYTSASVNSGSSYSLTVTDGGGCPALVVTGSNICVSPTSCSTTGCFGPSLLVDGSFENFNPAAPLTNFTSDYAYIDCSNSPCTNSQGQSVLCNYAFGVNTNASLCNPGFLSSITDHTTGSGNMMLIDMPGNNVAPNNRLWCTTANLLPSTNYCFGAWFINLLPSGTNFNNPEFYFSLSGTSFNQIYTLPENEQWNYFSYQFTSGAGGNQTVCIHNNNYGVAGYDLAMDDVALRAVSNGTPPTVTDDAMTLCPGATSKTINVVGNDQGVINANSLTILVPPPFGEGTATVNTANGTVTFTPNAGFSGTTSFQYQICDNGFCCATGIVTVSTTPNPVVNAGVNQSVCNGASAVINVSASSGTPAYTYNWSNGLGTNTTATVTPSSTTTYTVTVTDANGCVGTDDIQVAVLQPLAVNIAHTNAVCNGQCNGTATATATGGLAPYTYTWTNATGTVVATNTSGIATGLCPGTYNVSVSDSNGTGNIQSFWTETFDTGAAGWTYNVPTGTNGSDSNVWEVNDDEGGVGVGSCGVGNNGNQTLHVTCQGFFCIGNGAVYNASGFLNVTTNKRAESPVISTLGRANIVLSFNFIGNGQALLDNASVLYSTDGGANYLVLDPSLKTTLCANGQGRWEARNYNLPASCNNIPNLKIAFNWTNNADGQGTDPSFAVNDIRLSAPTSIGQTCSVTGSANITQPSTALTGGITATAATCGQSNGTVQTNLSGGVPPYTYTWNPASITGAGSNAVAGGTSASVTMTDANGCAVIATATVNGTQAVVVQPSSTNTSCGGNNGSASVSVSSGTPNYTYTWSPNVSSTASANNIAAGTYNILITDNNGCSATTSANIAASQGITVTEQVTDESCAGENDGAVSVAASPTGSYTYQWSDAGLTGTQLTGLNPGNYTLTVSDNICQTVETYTVVAAVPLIADAGIDQTINVGESATLTASPVGYNYTWTAAGGFNETGSPIQVTPASTTIYTLLVSNGICSDTDTITVFVDGAIVLEIPNVFTPTEDGKNDTFKPVNLSPSTKILDFKIYNRWGKLVYDGTSNNHAGWDGKFEGETQPRDTYIYQIRAGSEFNTQEPKLITGDVTLIR